MSVQAIAYVLDRSLASGAVRLVLISIANHVGPDGEGWVHVDRVCAEAAVSVDSYHRAVKWAIENGELEREVQAGGSKNVPNVRRPNLFRFPGMGGQDAYPEGDAGVGKVHTPGVGKVHTPRGGQDAYPPPPQDAYPLEGAVPRAVQEPSKEPADSEFDEFYASYPRKVGKPAARRSWATAMKSTKPDRIIAGLALWVTSWSGNKTEQAFIPHPSTWLNQRRWEDQPPPIRRSGTDASIENARTAAERIMGRLERQEAPPGDQGRLAIGDGQ